MTTYRFTINNKVYTAKGANRFEAQNAIELAHDINLNGATFEEIWKLRVVRKGIVK
jgi:hypothetical protein